MSKNTFFIEKRSAHMQKKCFHYYFCYMPLYGYVQKNHLIRAFSYIWEVFPSLVLWFVCFCDIKFLRNSGGHGSAAAFGSELLAVAAGRARCLTWHANGSRRPWPFFVSLLLIKRWPSVGSSEVFVLGVRFHALKISSDFLKTNCGNSLLFLMLCYPIYSIITMYFKSFESFL